MTRWLTDLEQRAWRGYIEMTFTLFGELDQRMMRDCGLPLASFEILQTLVENPDGLRVSELADAVKSSRSRLSHAIGRLEESGWVQRERDPDDLRGQVVRITTAGAELAAAAREEHRRAVDELLLDHLTDDERAELIEVFRSVVAACGTPRGIT